MDANNGYKMDLELNVKGMRGIFRDIVLYTLYNLGEAHGYAIRGFINKNYPYTLQAVEFSIQHYASWKKKTSLNPNGLGEKEYTS